MICVYKKISKQIFLLSRITLTFTLYNLDLFDIWILWFKKKEKILKKYEIKHKPFILMSVLSA